MAIIHRSHVHKVLINNEWEWPGVEYDFDDMEQEVTELVIEGFAELDGKMIQDVTETIIETGACYG